MSSTCSAARKVEVTGCVRHGRKELVSSHKIHLNPPMHWPRDVDYSDVDLVVLPGGIPGTPQPSRQQDRHLRPARPLPPRAKR